MEHVISLIGQSFVLVIIIRSAFNFRSLLSNLNWLKNKNKLPKSIPEENFLVCIPMLREQGIVNETLNYFSRLNYPKDKYRLVVVTTERENSEKKMLAKRLKNLAHDISFNKNLEALQNKYLGLLPKNLLEKIFLDTKNKSEELIFKQILQEYQKLPSTFTLAKTSASLLNSKFGHNFIQVLNYPSLNGVMSHQINYVVRKMAKLANNRSQIFVVYNADSRPHRDTFLIVAKTLDDFLQRTGIRADIVQQSSLFTQNYNSLPKSLSGYFLKAAALFQTKWTLVHELSRLRSQSETVIKPSKSILTILLNTKLSHCVGHGLFVRLELLSKEYLPTETVNEDLPFGYYQCCWGRPILPLPLLENSESPESIQGLFNQKRVWFWPYLQYGLCEKRVLKFKHFQSRLAVKLLTIQGNAVGLIWLFQSLVFIFPLVLGIYLKDISLLFIWTTAVIFYWFLPIAIIYINLNRLETIAGKKLIVRDFSDWLFVSLSGLFVVFSHSVGPILCFFDYLRIKYLGKPIVKQKTER